MSKQIVTILRKGEGERTEEKVFISPTLDDAVQGAVNLVAASIYGKYQALSLNPPNTLILSMFPKEVTLLLHQCDVEGDKMGDFEEFARIEIKITEEVLKNLEFQKLEKENLVILN